ncbi:MAG: nodulation protein NfeD [Candidatus Omnitrophica bacterium]|nr:nodulation protein NfeD [Candidatus Omnitrophota bacterium]
MKRKNNVTLWSSLLLFLAGLFILSLPSALSAVKDPGIVCVVDIDDMIINPIVQEIVAGAIETAQEKDSQCLIVRMDTPGGLMECTHKIVKDIMNSPIPVVVYVWPQGARAASAGVFITISGHFASMADSTHIGAAHPVVMNKSWGSIDEEMQNKVLNDAEAWIESLAKNRDRNVQWARKAVTESVSITEKEAQRLNVIDFVAKDLDELLEHLDNKEVEINNTAVTLHTKNAPLYFIEQSARQKFLNNLINPNIAYIFMLLGFFGLIYEVTHPGFGFPGIAGIICLLLAFYAFQVLPTNYAGLALIILGLAFFVIEAFTPTFGAFTLAGVVSLVFGSTILFNQPYEFLRVSLRLIIPTAVGLGLIFTFLVTQVIRAHRRKTTVGAEALVGQVGLAKSNISEEGKVFIHGELWDAESKDKIKKGEKVEIEKVEGLKLIVKKHIERSE